MVGQHFLPYQPPSAEISQLVNFIYKEKDITTSCLFCDLDHVPTVTIDANTCIVSFYQWIIQKSNFSRWWLVRKKVVVARHFKYHNTLVMRWIPYTSLSALTLYTIISLHYHFSHYIRLSIYGIVGTFCSSLSCSNIHLAVHVSWFCQVNSWC